MLISLVKNLDYTNFKNAVGRNQSQQDKVSAYYEIWDVMFSYQNRVES